MGGIPTSLCVVLLLAEGGGESSKWCNYRSRRGQLYESLARVGPLGVGTQ